MTDTGRTTSDSNEEDYVMIGYTSGDESTYAPIEVDTGQVVFQCLTKVQCFK